jgi:hypothetical protein
MYIRAAVAYRNNVCRVETYISVAAYRWYYICTPAVQHPTKEVGIESNAGLWSNATTTARFPIIHWSLVVENHCSWRCGYVDSLSCCYVQVARTGCVRNRLISEGHPIPEVNRAIVLVRTTTRFRSQIGFTTHWSMQDARGRSKLVVPGILHTNVRVCILYISYPKQFRS